MIELVIVSRLLEYPDAALWQHQQEMFEAIAASENLSKEDAYAFGDSNNDLPMLSYLPNSVAMGNAYPASLFDRVSFVTKKASEDGIAFALEHFSFL